MKGFLEEYGLVVIVAIIMAIFMLAATPIGEYIRDAIMAIISKFVTESGVTGITPPTLG